MTLSKDAALNRAAWDRESRSYQERHGKQLGTDEFVWGVWSIPETQLGILGDVRGKRVLELGCGAAQLAIAMHKMGAQVTALDNSGEQLAYAEKNCTAAGCAIKLVHASADDIPLPANSFDLVFCDHGAMTFSPTAETLCAVNRVLVTGGELIFNVQSPIHELCYDPQTTKIENRLVQNYFTLGRIDETDQNGMVCYQHSFGTWIRLFTEAGFTIISLTELQPPEHAQTSYDFAPYEWARQWPAENIWKLRKTSTI